MKISIVISYPAHTRIQMVHWHHKKHKQTQIAKFMGPTGGSPGSCQPQLGPMLAPWILLSGNVLRVIYMKTAIYLYTNHTLFISGTAFLIMLFILWTKLNTEIIVVTMYSIQTPVLQMIRYITVKSHFNSLAPMACGNNIRSIISEHMLHIHIIYHICYDVW